MSRLAVGVYMQETFTLRFCLCPDMQLVCICRKLILLMSQHTVGVYMQETPTLRFCLCHDMQLVCICRKLSRLGFAYVPTYSWCVYAGNFHA